MIEGNRLYLICQSHPDEQHSLMIGLRRGAGYCRPPSANQIQAWFDEHANCPGGLDHFKSALAKPANWDQSPPAPPIDKHVRLELVKTA